MKGGGLGPYAPGEWSDDTQMALCIAQVAATQPDLTNPDALDAIAQAFLDWRLHGATDDCGDSPRIPRRRQADLSADDWPRRGRCRHRPGRQRGPDEDLGRQPVRLGLRRAKWRACLDRAETEPPSSFNPNGYTVSALQAPWASI